MTDKCLNCSCTFATGCLGAKAKSGQYEKQKVYQQRYEKTPKRKAAKSARRKAKKDWLNYDRKEYFRQREKQKRIKRARDKFLAMNAEKKAIAAMGFKKYDKRRKPDTPQRAKWRFYKSDEHRHNRQPTKQAEIR